MRVQTHKAASSTPAPERLRGIRRGLEKESLRTRPDGRLALTPHPAAMGSALTHPRITTDFSESQLEFVTSAHDSVSACLDDLRQTHQFACRALGEERLWVSSMPCGLPPDEGIPLGHYGSSHIGRAKTVYRMGLGHRYGRRMQTISGIHYNWSMPGLDDADYFALIRNFRRHAFLVLALFGASPAVCASFVAGREHALQPLSTHSLHLPHATSLRMGRLGYQSDAQATLAVSYNTLETYATSLEHALNQPYPPYAAIGVRNLAGEYNQLSTSLLQIENENYGTIRPKRAIRYGERPLHALRERGVEYVELRCLDLDPFEPLGVAATTLHLLDVFVLHCLLHDSPPDTPDEVAEIRRNQQCTAERGREPGLTLGRGGREVALSDWAAELLAECAPIAESLDAALGGNAHATAVTAAQAAIADPATLPSARVLDAVRREHDGNFTAFVRARSEHTRQALLALPWTPAQQAAFEAMAAKSLQDQRAIEAADVGDFESFRRAYVSTEQLKVPSPSAA